MVTGVLYVSRAQAGFEATIAHTEVVLRKRYGDDYDLEVVDVMDEPDRAESANVVATPVLVISNGSGEKRFVGELDELAMAARL